MLIRIFVSYFPYLNKKLYTYVMDNSNSNITAFDTEPSANEEAKQQETEQFKKFVDDAAKQQKKTKRYTLVSLLVTIFLISGAALSLYLSNLGSETESFDTRSQAQEVPNNFSDRTGIKTGLPTPTPITNTYFSGNPLLHPEYDWLEITDITSSEGFTNANFSVSNCGSSTISITGKTWETVITEQNPLLQTELLDWVNDRLDEQGWKNRLVTEACFYKQELDFSSNSRLSQSSRVSILKVNLFLQE